MLSLAACASSSQPAMFERAAEGLDAAQRRTGDLALTCEPPDSEVWVDGVPVGPCGDFSGRRGLSLGQRMSKVEVRKEGYRTFETFVEPDGTRAALTVTLAPSSWQGEHIAPQGAQDSTTGGGP